MEQKILQLQPYMYGSGRDDSPPSPSQSAKKICGDKDISPQKMDAIEPTQTDTLLWCCYILLNSLGAYEYIKSVSSSGFSNADALELRRSLVDEIIKNPTKIKSHCNHKVTKVALEEIKSNLLTGVNIKIPELIVFCVYYNKNIMVVFDNKICMKINNGITECDALDAIIFYNSKTKKYSISTFCGGAAPREGVEKSIQPRPVFEKEFVEIVQYTKPVRGFSCYKMAELEDLYMKLSGNTGSANAAPTKKEMYELIYREMTTIYPHFI